VKNEILKFINKRPKVIGAYGYGSGVFKQSGYTEKDKPQIDLILVVDNLKEWHNENMKLNSKDY
jgi:translocator assembly and maintenance protein 41